MDSTNAVARLFEELWNQGRFENAEELITPSFVAHGADISGALRGPETVKAVIAEWRTAFPDLRFTIDDWIEAGDRVATRWHWEGTHLGHFAGVAPSFKRLGFAGLTLWRLSEGRVAEAWVAYDVGDLIAKLQASEEIAAGSRGFGPESGGWADSVL